MDLAQFRSRIDQIYRDLDDYTYYELLKITPAATADDVRRAFHRMARSMHPDRHQQTGDDALRDKLYAIYKRITEGYRILKDHRTRREYDALLEEGQRRLIRKQRPRRRQAEDAFADPQVKKFFRMAEAAERRGDRKTARLNYQLALNLAGDHPVLRERLDKLSDN